MWLWPWAAMATCCKPCTAIVSTGTPIYGMNRGSVGFLMNDYAEGELLERLHAAELTTIHPLRMVATDESGKIPQGHRLQ